MPDPIDITLGPVLRPYTAPLPNGQTFSDTLVLTRAEFGDLSEAELRGIAEERVEAHLAFLADPSNAQAIRDAEELVDQIEQTVDVQAPGWVQVAFLLSEQSGQLLQTLAQRDRSLWDAKVAERANDQTFGPLWQQFLSQFDG